MSTYIISMADPYSAWFTEALQEWSEFIPEKWKWEETTVIHEADLIVGWSDFADPHGIAYTGPNPFTTLVSFDPQSTDNFYEVALHEIGHVLGLDHYDEADAVMNSNGGSDTGHLTDADIEHIQELYPYSWHYGWHIEPDWEYGWYWDDFSYWWYFDNGWWAGWWWCTGGWWFGWHQVPVWDYGWWLG